MESRVVLLVEDNPDDEEMTLRALRSHNLANNVVVVRDGAAALEYLFGTGEYGERDPADTPAAVLLDLELPKVNGIEVLRKIRADARTCLTPVVILASSEADEDRLASYREGCNSFVRKPVGFAAFADAVRQLGLYWLLLNQPPNQ